jgi:hypothetical protein
MCQQRKWHSSFDHLVGALQQRRRHFDAKRLCGLQIDHQFELGGLLDRQVGRVRTLENLVDENGGPTIEISNIRSVGQKEASAYSLWREAAGSRFLKAISAIWPR